MQKRKSSIYDYNGFIKIASGSYGDIMEIKKNGDQNTRYALKKIRKQQLIKQNKLYQPYIEKQILSKLSHKGIIKMYDTFSDHEHIYFVLQFCELGQFYSILNSQKLPEITKKHYIGEMVLILQYLKSRSITHRDFKCSNLLVTKTGHLKLTDFGSSYATADFLGQQLFQKINSIKQISAQQLERQLKNIQQGIRRATFVGTPYYMSPELLKDSICNFEADLWALGCVIYEMYVGLPPFIDGDQYTVFKKIQEQDVKFPPNIQIPENAKDLIIKLLNKNKKQRLGCGNQDSDNNFNALKNHPYFKQIKWNEIFDEQIPNFKQILNSITMKQLRKKKDKQKKFILSGTVSKKMFLGNYKERQMTLNEQPKLIYYDQQSGEKKGQIELDLNTPIELDGNKFTVTGKKKKYFFKVKKNEHQHSASQWVQKIKQAITNAYL